MGELSCGLLSAGGLSNYTMVQLKKLYIELVRCFLLEEITTLDHSTVLPDRVTPLVMCQLGPLKN